MKQSALGTRILLALVTAGVLAYFAFQGLSYFGDPLTTTLAYRYQVEDRISVSGYVVRREQVLPREDSGLLRLQRSEGERVSVGGLVGAVYADQASLDRQGEIAALQTQLEQLEYAQEAALGSEVSLKLDAQIMQSLLSFRSYVAADRLDKAASQGGSLRGLVLKRDYTYADAGDLSGRISELKTQISGLRAQSGAQVRRITAPVSGLYSAAVDGYEQALTPDALDGMTPSQLESVQADHAVSSNVGKLILGDSWYYAVVMDARAAAEVEDACRALERRGGALTLRFAKTMEEDLPVTVSSVGPEENGRAVVVLRGETHLPRLTLLRRQSAELIWGAAAGIRVPTEALRVRERTVEEEDGTAAQVRETGVYCVVGVEARFKPVEVLRDEGDFVLVRADVNSDQEALRLRPGDEVIVTARNLEDGKIVGTV